MKGVYDRSKANFKKKRLTELERSIKNLPIGSVHILERELNRFIDDSGEQTIYSEVVRGVKQEGKNYWGNLIRLKKGA